MQSSAQTISSDITWVDFSDLKQLPMDTMGFYIL